VAGALRGLRLVHAGGDVTGWPYERRRAALETLFADHRLEAPLTLCPSTTETAVACGWLAWTAAGLEGLCFKRLDEPYVRGARSWRKYKVRVTTEAVTGALAAPGRCCWAATTLRAACSTPGAAPPCLAAPPRAAGPIPRPATRTETGGARSTSIFRNTAAEPARRNRCPARR
jgi:hypothetical protein